MVNLSKINAMLIYIDMDLSEKEKESVKSNTQGRFQVCFQDELKSDAERLQTLQGADIILGNPRPEWLAQLLGT